MTDLAFLLDAPDAPARRYGEFAIDPAIVSEWQRKLATTFDGQVPIDLDHRRRPGGSTRAAGGLG